jgi:hypothetical protein
MAGLLERHGDRMAGRQAPALPLDKEGERSNDAPQLVT